jgi:arylsulfatase
MKPAQFAGTFFARVPALAFGLLLAVATVAAADRPNIVLVITDDQGFGPVGRHGNAWLRTPNMDALHDTSVRFTRFLVSPTCAPTRSALMTGRHPFKNGITHTINERERMTLDAVTLPQLLKRAGYTSGIFGKWHLGDEDAYQPNRRGFDEVFIHGAGGIGQFYDNSCADAPGNRYFDPVIRHNGRFEKTHGFCTDVFFEAAIGWIGEKARRKEPFFAYIASNAPHSPYNAPEANRKRFADLGFKPPMAGFYGMIENIDENLGRLMAKLTDLKLLTNTVVIFMSDNGSAGDGLGKGGLGKTPEGKDLVAWNDNMKGTKNTVEEGGVRVPFFVRWDGHFEPRRDIDRLAAHIDILPTLLELVGVPTPVRQVEGRSLLPLIRDPQTAAAWKDRMLFDHVGRWPIGAEPNAHQWKDWCVRNQRYRLVNGALFDMQDDPAQTTDVSAKYPDIVAEMRSGFDRFWKEARPMMVNEGVPMSKTRPYWVAYEKQKAEGGIPEWKAPKP